MGIIGSFAKMLGGAHERRKHPRFAVSRGAIVVLGPRKNNHREVQLLDISKGGLAFIYSGSAEDLKASGVLSLLAEDKVELEDLHYDTVADYSLPARREHERDFRKRCVKFAWLGFLDKQDLENFISHTSVGQL